MADLCPLALAMIAVSEGNRRLRAEVAARDAALDACADRAADRAVRAYEHGLAAGRVEMELRAAERQVLTLTERLAEVTDELATVQADRAAADRNAATYRRDLLALQDRVVELEGRLAEAQDDARADRDALQRYRERDEAAKAGAPDDYFILSLRWTRDNLVTWWCPDNSGYTDQIEQAGRYSRARVEGNRAYYDNGTTTLAVPCAAVEAAAVRVVKDWALEKLTGKRFRDRLDEPGEDCDVCGQSPPQTRLGIAIVEPKEST